MQGITLSEQGHVVNALPPADANGGLTSARWKMSDWRHASIIVSIGNSTASSTITVKECSAAAGGEAIAIPFAYYSQEVVGGDVLSGQLRASSGGLLASSNSSIFYVAEVDARELSDGFPYLEVTVDPGANSVIVGVQIVLTGGRHIAASSPTVLA